LTIKTDSDLYISIHEANLIDYSSMTLRPARSDALTLECNLVPWSDGDKVKTKAPLLSPWRTITIARKATDLLASRMILNLNPPSKIEDTSWIRPMKYIGIWWGMHINKYSWTQGEIHGATTENVKRYIDFAARNNIQGVLAEGWNHDWERYGQKNAFKFTEPYDDFDIEAIRQYAQSKGVALIGHHETGREAPYYEEQLEDAYKFLNHHDIHAVKTGYAGGENIYPINETHQGQWMVEHHQRVVEMAARYKVLVNIHEPVKSTGLERSWPNLMTREGTRGMEWNAWSEGNPPSHTTILPFTRQLAGPIDYTPGIFDLHFDQYKPENRVKTTLAKQLALMVVIYSPMQMAADLIENYMDQPAFQFIRDLPNDWDESRYLSGEIAEHVTIVRKSGDEWFLGAITNERGRKLRVPLADFIDSDMIAECYSDGAEADWESNPYALHIGQYLASPSDTLNALIAPGGGLAIRFLPKSDGAASYTNISKLMMNQ
ncbi:MAG: glycoside hydrolase family 97 protein, partial [Candidatus Marinimicrobia bacterium]|nr:glycoside hydrolase family 97 protein [Candidatus Neomarinimicrobiota bacterium]